MKPEPLEEILHTEREIKASIVAATAEAANAVAAARAKADRLVEEAHARGQATAERRYAGGLAKALDEGDRIRDSADDWVATLRRQAEPHLAAAVDIVLETVLPSVERN